MTKTEMTNTFFTPITLSLDKNKPKIDANKFISFSFTRIDTYMNSSNVEKKKAIGYPQKWQAITKTQIDLKHKAYAVITGKISNITVFDFDNLISYDKMISEHP